MKKLLLAFLFAVGAASAQVFPQAATSVRHGASLPATCRDSQVFFVDNTGMYQCVAGVWTVVPTSSTGGTVTVVGAGSLTLNALVTGGGSQTIQTPSATTTLDSSGNFSTPGSLATGVGGSAAGYWQCTQGTAHTAAVNSSGFQCPTSVTSAFMFTLPGAPAVGFMRATNAAPSVISVSPLVTGDLPSQIAGTTFTTATNCADSAGAAACGSAAAGSFVADAAATSVVVSTTAVTANSEIFVEYDGGLSTRLSVTCNATIPALYAVTARTAGTSFTLTTSASVTNPGCFSYHIVN